MSLYVYIYVCMCREMDDFCTYIFCTIFGFLLCPFVNNNNKSFMQSLLLYINNNDNNVTSNYIFIKSSICA